MVSSKVRIAVVLAGLLLAVPALSSAQAPGGGRGGRGGVGGGRGGVTGLLMMEAVQKEVGISDEQKAELTKLGEEARGAAGAGGGFNREEFQKLSEEERTKKYEEMRKEGEERAKKAEEKIKAILKPEQWTRLSELRTQQDGLRALSREDVQKSLGLNEEQVGKLKTLNDANRASFGGGFGRPGQTEEERTKANAERETRTKKFEEDVKAVLTADQTAAFEKLKGTKFEFPARGTGAGGAGGTPRRRPE